MEGDLVCYQCGASLAALSLPFSRYDECPSCTRTLRVCRMCCHFDAAVARQCREDDAEEVRDKQKLNFCDWFEPGHDLFDQAAAAQEGQALRKLEALFGDDDGKASEADPALRDAEDLFK